MGIGTWLVCVGGICAPALTLGAQGTAAAKPAAAPTARPTAIAATPAPAPPVIDGRDDDPIWATAATVTAFRENHPVEDGEPTFRTVARIAYDARYLYVFLRAYDPHPDSITAPLARRDAIIASDWMGVLIDSYHDRRTGYEFDVNPAGVKSDWSIQNDGDEDITWDGVWDAAARVDSLGWTAEFRIPLSQLRYPVAATDTFGIYFWRSVNRLGENLSWPGHRTSRPGLVSQFGDLTGLAGLAPPTRAEVMPYVVSQYRSAPAVAGISGARATLGGDLRYAVASNVALTATVNPDFGQVEADPAQLNLTAFETFFPEQRPFFVQGADLFNVPLNCGLYNCPNENLFYSRRIGRAPQLGGVYADPGAPGATGILGAGKLTGRVGATSFGALGAATERVSGLGGVTLEPGARYSAFRLTQDFRNGESGIGAMLTEVHRDLDSSSAPYLHRDAVAGGLDFRHRFLGQYLLHGSTHWSEITGSREAIAATQRDAVHDYQRPDGTLRLDTTRTALMGNDEQLAFDKVAGIVQWQAIYTRRSPGFDVNDIGYLQQADLQTVYAWLGLNYTRPTAWYRTLTWNFNSWYWATTGGLPTDRAVNTNVHVTLRNLWALGAWVSVDGLGATYCDRCARGGPALRQDRSTSTWFNVTGDSRARLAPALTVRTTAGDVGRSRSVDVSPSLVLNGSTNLTASLGLDLALNRNNTQWLANPVDSTGLTHYTFARLDQRTVGVTARANYTVSTTLSIQAYVQPFVSWGSYRDVREIANARAANYADRFRPFSSAGTPAGLNDRQLKADVVVRWEYRPGSTLFVVWSQGRQGFAPASGSRGAWGNLQDVFSLPADNTFLVKLSYWFTR